MTLERRAFPSPNYSSRGGARVTTIVLHTAEGATTIESLGNWFANPSSGVSSHVGIDDKPNTVGEYVRRDYKAWTASNANPWSVQAELCAFAAWGPADWDAHPTMLSNTAAWVAEEAAHYGIPLTELSASEAQDPHACGVCQHNDLGSMGGGHWDCGPSFPIARVLDLARGGPTPEPEPPEPEDKDVANLTICAGPAPSDQQFLTDMGQWKRPIMSVDDFNNTLICLRKSGANVYETGVNTPIRVPQETLDAIPTVKR
jgi:N-acetylmuramoyl-L-alanine amidase